MGISLVKGQKISLAKADGASLTRIYLGAGWDVAKGGGFMGGLFGGGGSSIDLDASAILFDEAKQPLDTSGLRNCAPAMARSATLGTI